MQVIPMVPSLITLSYMYNKPHFVNCTPAMELSKQAWSKHFSFCTITFMNENVYLKQTSYLMCIRVLQKGHFSTKKPRETRHVNIWPIRNHFKPKKVPKLQCRGSDLSVQNWHFVWFLLWFFKLVVLKNLPQKVQSFKIPIFCAFKVQTTLV